LVSIIPPPKWVVASLPDVKMESKRMSKKAGKISPKTITRELRMATSNA